MGSIVFVSIAKIFPEVINFVAICDHPPGLDPKSKRLVFFFKLNFLFSSNNLKDALDLKPKVFDFLKN